MKKRKALIITFLSIFLIGGFAACKRGHHGSFDEFDQEALVKRISSRLDLSESQKADLQDIIAEITAKAKSMHADHENRHQRLANLVRQETISAETVDQVMTEKFDKMQELANLAADRLLAFHATLTPEQREKLAVHIEKKGENKRCFFGK